MKISIIIQWIPECWTICHDRWEIVVIVGDRLRVQKPLKNVLWSFQRFLVTWLNCIKFFTYIIQTNSAWDIHCTNIVDEQTKQKRKEKINSIKKRKTSFVWLSNFWWNPCVCVCVENQCWCYITRYKLVIFTFVFFYLDSQTDWNFIWLCLDFRYTRTQILTKIRFRVRCAVIKGKK